MPAILLQTHNILRWAILILGVIALVKAAQGLSGDRPYAPTRRIGLFFTSALHLQLLLGLGLFGVSPFMKAAMGRANRKDLKKLKALLESS